MSRTTVYIASYVYGWTIMSLPRAYRSSLLMLRDVFFYRFIPPGLGSLGSNLYTYYIETCAHS